MNGSQHTVISGVPHRVTSVGGDEPPSALEGFLGDTEFTIDMSGTPYVVHGCGSRLDTQVRFHEKQDALRHDIRVWHVTQVDHGFVAEHVAAF
ncbi:MAG: hypothetical protein M4D85_10075 [Actinomycetota bacterium]|nr:hypothetical protein [Actinomycetota bacterium]